MGLEPSLEVHFAPASTTSFGDIHVTLGKRQAASADFPCSEVLQVIIGTEFTDDDLQRYIRFHNAYVLHRVKHEWPHRFSIIYDARSLSVPSDWLAFVERILAFSMMHAKLGDHYRRWLHRVCVMLRDAGLADRIRQVQAPFVDSTTKPLLFHIEGRPPLVEALRTL